MDEKCKVLTLIRKDHKFGGNDYVIGRISGIGYIIGGQEMGFANIGIDEGIIYRQNFTVDEYEKFMEIVEELYPGLCEFNYQIKKRV